MKLSQIIICVWEHTGHHYEGEDKHAVIAPCYYHLFIGE
jgi:hypothetical protein